MTNSKFNQILSLLSENVVYVLGDDYLLSVSRSHLGHAKILFFPNERHPFHTYGFTSYIQSMAIAFDVSFFVICVNGVPVLEIW